MLRLDDCHADKGICRSCMLRMRDSHAKSVTYNNFSLFRLSKLNQILLDLGINSVDLLLDLDGLR
jgi:hypothetical protein